MRLFVLLAACTAALGAQPTVRQLRLTEDLRIDGNKNDFGAIPFGFMLVNPHGQMAFADWTSFKLRIFDVNGKNLSNYGAKGDGPGEFSPVNFRGGQRANFEGGLVGDSIWILERSRRQLSFVSNTGRFLRAIHAPDLPPEPANGANSALKLQGASPIAVLGDGSVLANSVSMAGDAAPDARPNFLVLIAPGGKSYRVIAAIPEGSSKSISVTDPRTGKPTTWSIPFTPRASRAVAPDGNRIVLVTPELTSATSGSFRITVISAHGDTLSQRTHPLTGQPLKQDVVDNYFKQLEGDLRASMPNGQPAFDPKLTTEVLSKLRKGLPKVRLTIGQVRVGIDNSIWLALVTPSGEAAWYVFDERGAAIGYVVHKPKNGFMLQAASKNMMWGMEYDDDGVPSIVRYRVS